MKNRIKSEYIFLISIAFLCISFIIIFTIFIFREKYTNELSNEFIADRITSTLIDAHNDNRLKETIRDNKNVLGFGIYNAGGYSNVLYGSAPDRLDRTDFFEIRGFKHNRANNSIIYIKPLRPQFQQMMKFRNKMHEMMMGPPREVSYLELRSPDFFKRKILFNIFSFIVPLFIILLTISFMILYNKNLKYRETLEKQKEMVKLGEISRTLAHEIKNPLSAMRIQSGYLQKIIPDEFKEDIKPINQEIERLRLLTDRIGDLLRNPLGNPEKINVAEYISDVIKNYSIKINFIDNSMQKMFINFDKERLRSIFENVIINSIESTEGMKDGQIDIKIFNENKNACILLVDNGSGLAADYNDKIFDPYYTTKTKGTGLGLSITKRFVEAGGGRIKISPGKDNNGTIVEIKLPLSDTREKA